MKNRHTLQDGPGGSRWSAPHVGHEARRTCVKEDMMKTPKLHQPAKAAILAIADVKAAVEAFDRGETNVFAALKAVLAAVADSAANARARRKPVPARRHAA